MWEWSDDQVCAFDYETSGTRPEYALQPWRRQANDFFATSLVWLWPERSKLRHAGGLHPTPEIARQFVEWALDTGRTTVCAWNALFDLSVLLAYDVPLKLLCRLNILDGYLLWRHADITPEYDGKKRSFSLKNYVREHFPEHAGYEEKVDYHSTDPAELAKLHEYNIKDNIFTLRACKQLWARLEPRQRVSAWIEGQTLPLIADGNLQGLLIDTIAAHDLRLRLDTTADECLAKLAPHGMTEEIIRSPKQLEKLMFEDWGLPVHKLSPKGNRSTDKESLHELSLKDERAALVRQYREALGNMMKFAQVPLESVDYNGDGRVHPLARVFGTYSGRMTYASKQKDRKGQEGVEDAMEEVGDE